MFELKQIAGNTYCFEGPVKVGLYKLSDQAVCLIDSGNDKDTGRKILKAIKAEGWELSFIINTHAHADHIGGNQYLQEQTGCAIYAKGIEIGFTSYPQLESAFLYGAYAHKELQHKALMAKPSRVNAIEEAPLPDGMSVVDLTGHSYDMMGIQTPDGVLFIADSLLSATILGKYPIAFAYDIDRYYHTLNTLKGFQNLIFVPAHGEITTDIQSLIALNDSKAKSVEKLLLSLCRNPITFDDLLKAVFDYFHLTMTIEQHALVGSTIRSYLSYLFNLGQVTLRIEDNRQLWVTQEVI